MDERTALLTAVLNGPADDTDRLVLADWLEEHGEEHLGRFIRAGVAAARFSGADLIDDPDYYSALRVLSRIATAGHPAAWLAAVGLGTVPLGPGDWAWDNAADRVTVRIGASAGVFRRGLLSELDVSLARWSAVAAPVLSAWPIERVRASDVPGLSFEMTPVATGWRLTGRVKMPRRNVPLIRTAVPTAIAPGAVLTDSSAELVADQLFPDRPSLVAGAVRECEALVKELADAAGDRWPRSPQRRRPPG